MKNLILELLKVCSIAQTGQDLKKPVKLVKYSSPNTPLLSCLLRYESGCFPSLCLIHFISGSPGNREKVEFLVAGNNASKHGSILLPMVSMNGLSKGYLRDDSHLYSTSLLLNGDHVYYHCLLWQFCVSISFSWWDNIHWIDTGKAQFHGFWLLHWIMKQIPLNTSIGRMGGTQSHLLPKGTTPLDQLATHRNLPAPCYKLWWSP